MDRKIKKRPAQPIDLTAKERIESVHLTWSDLILSVVGTAVIVGIIWILVMGVGIFL